MTIPVTGVQFIEPPAEKIKPIIDAIQTAFKQLPPGAKGGLFLVFNEKGTNAAVVSKTKGGVQVEAYIGKTWKGSTNYGVNAMKIW